MPDGPTTNDPARPLRIVHSQPGIGGPASSPAPASSIGGIAPPGGPISPSTSAIPVPPPELATAVATAIAPSAAPSPPKVIRSFGDRKRHEDSWTRTPNTTGTGAIHVKTFHCKLTDEALVFIDQMINEWLDAHPQYEVKFVSSSIGDFTSKLKEPHLIVQVWV